MNKLSKIIADIVRENVDDAYFASSNTPFRLPLNPQVGNIVFQNQIPHDRSVISGAQIIALYVFFAYTKDHLWLMIDSSRPNTLTWKSHFDFCCYTRRSGELLYGTSQKYCGSCSLAPRWRSCMRAQPSHPPTCDQRRRRRSRRSLLCAPAPGTCLPIHR